MSTLFAQMTGKGDNGGAGIQKQLIQPDESTIPAPADFLIIFPSVSGKPQEGPYLKYLLQTWLPP